MQNYKQLAARPKISLNNQKIIGTVPDTALIIYSKCDHNINEATEFINNYSLLPEREDYVRPIGMITLPSVLKKALEQDTPQSRAIIAGGLAALGALVGHAVMDIHQEPV
ncbi:hypothetical protein [Rhodohalobacter barkolensis]|uniref:Uncharacterized protein n=1 Tax=Rhodohalobacter barkolensis TaxID=2053187 RepID=A0A2N0VHR7_9BACT|nr:hypothetical protein [Rhodohalobacter barkolensis]PKD43704.1 hypothetical protein CWD77_09085 [Rhodohalobacter barkolensis]